jgi:hypothetical protein
MLILTFLRQWFLLGKPLDDVLDLPGLLLSGLIGVVGADIGAVLRALCVVVVP